MIRRVVLQTGSIMLLLVLSMIMGGCSILFGGGGQPEATPTTEPRALVPTFTPTPVVEQAPAPTPVPPTPPQVIAVELGGESATEPAPEEGTEEGTEAPADASPTATPVPKLTVKVDAVNVRLGPGTEYGLAGLVNQGQEFTIVGRNEAKTWWLICCVNGKEVWIFDDLTDEDNEKFAPVITDIPAPPVAQAQPPAAQPEPTATAAPEQPQPAADPCAGIGGDGCKFKLRGSPKFAPNGGTELKLQLHFIHSGVDGGQPQGSYFVWVEKDGTKLPISDSVRSIALQDQQGTLGKYNYEYKVGLGAIPGNTVAGNYAIWVLDGNGERDSQTFSFTVPEGQGEVWMEFDQG